MKLAMYDDGTGPKSGIVVGDMIVSTGIPGGMIELISSWSSVKDRLEHALLNGSFVPFSQVKLMAPVSRPGKIMAIGLNYADHIAETSSRTPEVQLWFSKAVTSINGPNDPIEIAKNSSHVDYEAELVAVIGKRGRTIQKADAAAHIFGYCVGNDVSERLWQSRTAQWTLGKSFDTHAPIGPWITTADEVADPHNLELRCYVNGEERQHSNTRNLIFNLWEQIEHLSQAMTLEPGDLIFTGTPSGVGAAMNPRQFLKAGDVVRCEIETLGTIEGMMIDQL